MSRTRRLQRLEQHRPALVYPSFADRYDTQTKEQYDAWLIKHNPHLTAEHLAELNIKSFEDCYE